MTETGAKVSGDVSASVTTASGSSEGGSSVDVQALAFALWSRRDDPAFVASTIDLISEFLLDKALFNEIEFYLPQIAHIAIHIENHESQAALDRLVVMLCQASMHVALLLSFILRASIEDFQEETHLGVKNASADSVLCKRCAKLLHLVESAVIYSYPAVKTRAEIPALFSGNYATAGLRPLADKVLDLAATETVTLSGPLLYKRTSRSHALQRKTWKERWFKIQNKLLLCFHDSEYKVLRRSMHLQDCVVKKAGEGLAQEAKYDNYFEVLDCVSGAVFKLRARSSEDADKWIHTLRSVSRGMPSEVSEASSNSDAHAAMPASPSSDVSSGERDRLSLTPTKLTTLYGEDTGAEVALGSSDNLSGLEESRYKLFRSQQDFVRALTDICERLRFIERPDRPARLEEEQKGLSIPPTAYLPICDSTDAWRGIIEVLPKEGHAFTTKARCPALMMFELEEHPTSVDVASYLFHQAAVPTEVMIESPKELLSTSDSTPFEQTGNTLFPKIVSVESAGNRKMHCSVFKDNVSTIAEYLDVATNTEFARQLIVTAESRSQLIIEDDEEEDVDGYGLKSGRVGRMSVLDVDPGELVLGVDELPPIPEEGEAADADTAAVVVQEETAAWTQGSESFAEKTKRIQQNSQEGSRKNWKLDGLIAKSNDDLRQEVFVIQLISFFDRAFKKAEVDAKLYTYKIISTSKNTGLIQLIPDAISLDALKKQPTWPGSLRAYFEQAYGAPGTASFDAALDNFIESMAAYSIVTYLLAIKDRHNGNIMLHRSGQIIHIDFGFVFGLAPGKQFSMETAPWKLTVEMVDLMGGRGSAHYERYLDLCASALICARKNAPLVISMMEIMMHHSNYPAFRYNPKAVHHLRQRLRMDIPDEGVRARITRLANRSFNHSGTKNYDTFQVMTNGIAK